MTQLKTLNYLPRKFDLKLEIVLFKAKISRLGQTDRRTGQKYN